MKWARVGKALLFPHSAILILLTPIAIAFLVASMAVFGSESILAMASYVLAAYTLTAWCFKMPYLVKRFKRFKAENKHAQKWREDARLRVNVSLYGALAFNTLYGVFQLGLGVYHRTLWFGAFGVYYLLLAVMRYFLARHTSRYAAGEKMRTELIRYRASGVALLVMNLALSLIVFFMVYWNRTFRHHMITAIAMAAYTFAAFAAAIVNVVKYKKYNSPVFSASKAIGLVAALVSMLTLESTMLTTFSDGTMTATEQRIILGATGGAISALIIAMALYMIVTGTKKLKAYEKKTEEG